MTLILNGTSGLSDVDGSAATPAIRGTDANTGIFFPAADTIAFSEGGVEAMRIDSSGNVGIGITPSAWNSAIKPIQLGTQGAYITGITSSWSAGGYTYIGNNGYYDTSWKYSISQSAAQYTQAGDQHIWSSVGAGTAGAAITFVERMRIDSSGNLLVGTTSATSSGFLQITASNVKYGLVSRASTTNSSAAGFFNSSGTEVGSINTTGSTTSYVTSSDYRLKEAIAPMTGALAKVALLKPCVYKWKVDGSDGQGFIAHELAEVEAGCVTGEKDAVDADGNPKYQGIDTSFLVATLTAAIQEQQAIITQLQADVAALKAR